MNDRGIQAVISAAAAALSVYLGAMVVPVAVLMLMMLLDYISGMAAAWTLGTLSSRTGAKGIFRKVGYMALIIVAMGVDYLISMGIAAAVPGSGYNMWFGAFVAAWLIINEMISILENLGKLGVPIPDFLAKIIKHLKSSTGRKNK